MIKFKDVSFAYPNMPPVFEGLCFEASSGINIIRGESGIGKTTLLNLAAGLLMPNSGTVEKSEKMVGYMFQEPRLINELTVLQNLSLALASSLPDKNKRISRILSMLNNARILHAEKMYPFELSGGMAQRVALIRAMLVPSRLMLLDEPFKALDQNIRKVLINELISDVQKNQKTALIVTHDPLDIDGAKEYTVQQGKIK